MGVCGGFQMLGQAIHDPERVESASEHAPGLGLLPHETVFAPGKRTARVRGQLVARHGPLAAVEGAEVEGYEIHVGRTHVELSNRPFMEIDGSPEGSVAADLPVAGTHIHGMFERPEPRHALLRELAQSRGFEWAPDAVPRSDPYDVLADVIEESVRLDGLRIPSPAAVRCF